ncbi:MAG TPA: hypothetical protein VJ828_02365 [Lacipirellulaceae bacterium]|nr:hypothetical protein [Lacipirellulaceae bacterium]
MAGESELILKAESYAKNNGHRILRKARLGAGTDGEVWRSTRPSAIKVVVSAKNYQDELESYRRLKAAGIHRLCGFDIPRLFGWDDALQVIEMSIVQPPYLLDFGKVYFDGPPTDVYDSAQLKMAEAEAKANFGSNWPAVSRLLYALQEKVGIWYVDPKPANIDCGIDDPDWDKEPELDYSQYEDEFGEE